MRQGGCATALCAGASPGSTAIGLLVGVLNLGTSFVLIEVSAGRFGPSGTTSRGCGSLGSDLSCPSASRFEKPRVTTWGRDMEEVDKVKRTIEISGRIVSRVRIEFADGSFSELNTPEECAKWSEMVNSQALKAFVHGYRGPDLNWKEGEIPPGTVPMQVKPRGNGDIELWIDNDPHAFVPMSLYRAVLEGGGTLQAQVDAKHAEIESLVGDVKFFQESGANLLRAASEIISTARKVVECMRTHDKNKDHQLCFSLLEQVVEKGGQVSAGMIRNSEILYDRSPAFRALVDGLIFFVKNVGVSVGDLRLASDLAFERLKP